MTATIRQGIIFILIGPTGSGKSTFCARLVSDYGENLRYSVSATSRPQRVEEVEGKSYHFFSREEFQAKIDHGEFFEWEEIHGNFYGTLRSSLEAGISQGSDLLYQIDIRGALNFKKAFPNNTVTIFIVPPNFESMQERLVLRGTTDKDELKRRFETARREYETLLSLSQDSGEIDYFLVNNDLDNSFEEISSVVISERSKIKRIDRRSIEELCKIDG